MTPIAEFEALFRTYQQPITAYLNHVLGSPERAEELAQEAFLRAYRAMLGGAQVAYPKAWLYQIATNVARDHLRRARLFEWLPWWDAEREPALCTTDTADAIAEQLIVRAALARLKPAYRVPLVLHLCEDLSTVEISEVFGIRQGAVKMRLARARRQFQCAFRALSCQESDEV